MVILLYNITVQFQSISLQYIAEKLLRGIHHKESQLSNVGLLRIYMHIYIYTSTLKI